MRITTSSLRHWRRDVLFGGVFVDPVEESDYYVHAVDGNDTAPTTGTLDDPFKTGVYATSRASTGESIGFMGDDVPAQYHYTPGLGTGLVNKVLTYRRAPYHNPVLMGNTIYSSSGDFAKTGGFTNVYEVATGITIIHGCCFNGHPTHYPMGAVASIAACDALENSYYLDPGNKLYVHVNGGGVPDHVWAAHSVTRCFVTGNGNSGTIAEYLTIKFANGIHLTAKAYGSQHENRYSNLTLRYLVSRSGGASDTAFADEWSTAPQIFENIDLNYRYNGGSGSGAVIAGQTIGQGLADSVFIINNLTQDNAGRAYYGQYGSVYIDGINSHQAIRTDYTQDKFVLKNFVVYNNGDNHLEIRSKQSDVSYGIIWIDDAQTPGGQPRGLVMHEGDQFRLSNILAWGFIDYDHLSEAAGFYIGTDANVFMRNCAAVRCGVGVYVPVANSPTLDLDHLAFYGNNNNYVNVAGGDQAVNVVTTDPKFVNQDNQNFHLQGSSPLIDEGEVVSNMTEEYSGTFPDIGRYEYGSLTQNNWLLAESGEALLTEESVEILA